MILFDKGYGKLHPEWHVEEQNSAGFSRVYYLLGGDVWYQDIEGRKKLKEGNLYLFPSYRPYSISHHKNNTICCLWVHVDLFPLILKQLVEVDPTFDPTLYHILEAMKSSVDDYCTDYNYFESLVNSLTDYLFHNRILTLSDDSFSDILSYVRNHTFCSISIEDISREFGYSKEHLIRMFQSKINITPYQYILNIRMNKACRMLMQNISIKQISKEVGYGDAKTFSNAFTSKFGVPPTKYKLYYKPMA